MSKIQSQTVDVNANVNVNVDSEAVEKNKLTLPSFEDEHSDGLLRGWSYSHSNSASGSTSITHSNSNNSQREADDINIYAYHPDMTMSNSNSGSGGGSGNGSNRTGESNTNSNGNLSYGTTVSSTREESGRGLSYASSFDIPTALKGNHVADTHDTNQNNNNKQKIPTSASPTKSISAASAAAAAATAVFSPLPPPMVNTHKNKNKTKNSNKSRNKSKTKNKNRNKSKNDNSEFPAAEVTVENSSRFSEMYNDLEYAYYDDNADYTNRKNSIGNSSNLKNTKTTKKRSKGALNSVSNFTPISPLTPTTTQIPPVAQKSPLNCMCATDDAILTPNPTKSSVMNRNKNLNDSPYMEMNANKEAGNLMSVLRKVSCKQDSRAGMGMGLGYGSDEDMESGSGHGDDYSDADVGRRDGDGVQKGRNKNSGRSEKRIGIDRNRGKTKGAGTGNAVNIDDNSDESDSHVDSSDTTPTMNQHMKMRPNQHQNAQRQTSPHNILSNQQNQRRRNLQRPRGQTRRQTSYGSTGYRKKSNRYNYHSINIRDDDTAMSPISLASSYQQQHSEYPAPQPPNLTRKPRKDPTLHAQTFVLALAFMAIWSAQNLMAPNLTQMAEYFNFTPDQRDLYLGANIAFATGVLSFPISALLGFLADIVVSRKYLYAGTVLVGGITSITTGYSETYTQLYFSRFLCGGCMSGSVPIAFSLIGDLFDAKDRNAASSVLMAMMGAGTLFGQVGAGMIGDSAGWKRPFYISGIFTVVTSAMVLYFVRDPVRGGKEKVLQEMIAKGTSYDRKLTVSGFLHAMTKNKTNVILMFQGLFMNIPWGVIYTFMNDYLSQEQGLSVPAATFLILWFGVGAATGGIVGGILGTKATAIRRSYLPLFMAVSTGVGILPWLGLLDLPLSHDNRWVGVVLAFLGGCIANLPTVNVRPCILNVNPPETRGAAMTAANLMINLARGIGPSLITLSQAAFGVTRQYSFNLSLIVFWSFTTILLLFLMSTLPSDQDAMDAELAKYAASRINDGASRNGSITVNGEAVAYAQNGMLYSNGVAMALDEMEDGSDAGTISHFHDDMTYADESIVSMESMMNSFDATNARESLTFIEDALREIAEISHLRSRPEALYEAVGEDSGDEEEYQEGFVDGDGDDEENIPDGEVGGHGFKSKTAL